MSLVTALAGTVDCSSNSDLGFLYVRHLVCGSVHVWDARFSILINRYIREFEMPGHPTETSLCVMALKAEQSMKNDVTRPAENCVSDWHILFTMAGFPQYSSRDLKCSL